MKASFSHRRSVFIVNVMSSTAYSILSTRLQFYCTNGISAEILFIRLQLHCTSGLSAEGFHFASSSVCLHFRCCVVTTRTQSCIYIVLFWPTEGLTTLKRVYRIKRSPYLYNIKNFPLYLMWDVTNTLPPLCKHNILVVSYRIAGPKRQTPLRDQTNSHTKVRDRFWYHCNDPHPTMYILLVLSPKGSSWL